MGTTNITPLDPRFSFHHFDVSSPYTEIDGQPGSIPAEHFTFPFSEGQFNAANLASVFTHMHFSEIMNYLYELSRVVRSGGTMVFSVFLTEKEPYGIKHNIFINPRELFEAVEKTGWRFIAPDLARIDKGEFLFDNNQQNFFTAIRE